MSQLPGQVIEELSLLKIKIRGKISKPLSLNPEQVHCNMDSPFNLDIPFKLQKPKIIQSLKLNFAGSYEEKKECTVYMVAAEFENTFPTMALYVHIDALGRRSVGLRQ